MRTERASRRPLRVTAFGAAKINIGLRVGPRRDDGYHDVCGLVQTVSLVDRLDVSTGDDAGPGIVVDVGAPLRLHVPGAPELETPENLVVAAARALAEGGKARPTSIRIDKAIPVAAGLGGGSADAAAAVTALNVVWGAGAAPGDLIEIAGRIGSDVPAIVAGGLVHIAGRGERVRHSGTASEGCFVLGISSDRIRAADAYRAFDRLPASSSALLHHNDLEAAACTIVPALRDRLAAMAKAGADPVFVSGSGPTVVGVAADREEAERIAERAAPAFDRVEVVRPSPWGVRLSIGAESPAIG